MLAQRFRDLRFGFRGPCLVEILFRGASAMTYFSKVLIGQTNLLSSRGISYCQEDNIQRW